MAKYQELVEKYKKRQHDTVIDSVTTALTYADNVAVDLGVMEESGVLTEALSTAGTVLPFAVIAVTEGYKVIVRKKSTKSAVQDSAFRAAKTGAAMGVGAAAAAAGGLLLAIPAAVTTRVILDRIRTRAMTDNRVAYRVRRMAELNERIRARQLPVISAEPVSDEQAALYVQQTMNALSEENGAEEFRLPEEEAEKEPEILL